MKEFLKENIIFNLILAIYFSLVWFVFSITGVDILQQTLDETLPVFIISHVMGLLLFGLISLIIKK